MMSKHVAGLPPKIEQYPTPPPLQKNKPPFFSYLLIETIKDDELWVLKCMFTKETVGHNILSAFFLPKGTISYEKLTIFPF